MKNRLLSIFAWVYLYTIGLILPSKLNKWAKNITKRGKQCSDPHSESQHISGLQNKSTA
ncbi:MAG: hypothetical protein KTV77_03510 [Wolbachia endosymbiont of Fragariocoptes setiger]|nr:hypothetical protein [Wolbachia endosymbiont of Fragariocoptes setiger]